MRLITAQCGTATPELFREDCALIARALTGYDGSDGLHAQALAAAFDLLVKVIDLEDVATAGGRNALDVARILASDHAQGEDARELASLALVAD
jgi:hypothetical protein